MISSALQGGGAAARCWTAAGKGQSLSASLNFVQAPLTWGLSGNMHVALKQAPTLRSQVHMRRSLHRMSVAVVSRRSHQDRDAMINRGASEVARSNEPRLRSTTGVVSSPGIQAVSLGSVSRNFSRGISSSGTELWSLRRQFSSGPRSLEHEVKNSRQQPPSPVSDPGPSSIRKVLPKSIGAALTPHENIYTVPNLLTFSRLIATPFIGYALLHDAHTWALGLFVYAGVSDLLDGWIARRWKLQTVVGSVIDPMADKMLMTVLTVCLAAKGALPVWLAVIILGRDVGLAISAIYYRWISLPPPKTFTRYWDFSLPSAEVRPTTISKYNTFLQLALMGSTVVAPLITGIEVGPALIGLQYIVATTTIWSGLSYVFSKDAVKILSDAKNKEPNDKEKPME